MQELYERWLSCGEEWSRSSWVTSLASSVTRSARGARRWMTKEQIKIKYNSSEIADEIVAAKMGPEHAASRKPHPDVPHRIEPKLH